jgi:hypothetical protein
MNLIENAPDLELDKVLYKDRTMPPHVRRERRIVWNLIKYLAESGWNVVKVYDGDEYTKTPDPKSALEVIFNLDDAQVGFKQESITSRTHYVKLVLGNDLDIISDWNYTLGDPDDFNVVMSKFDAEVYA